jgi:hypothetical protein
MPDQLPLFEIRLRKRSRACKWYLCTTEGRAVMRGSEGSRTAARYQAHRALFLMLLASAYRPPGLGHLGGRHLAAKSFTSRLSQVPDGEKVRRVRGAKSI